MPLEAQREKFEPAEVWTEDRWIFCRRMAGDELCAVLFHKMATFIWRSNEIQGDEMREYQDALITHVLGYNYKQEFMPFHPSQKPRREQQLAAKSPGFGCKLLTRWRQW